MSILRKKRRVMVVDDDEIVLEVTREHLQLAGFEVVTRASSLGTSAAVAREKPDVVLMDVDIPGLAGDAAAKLLADQARPPIVILYSSAPKEKLVELARRCGAIGVIEKTASRELFLAQLDACLATTVRRPSAI